MKKSVATNNMVRNQQIPAKNNKNVALKKEKVHNRQPVVKDKKHALGTDTVTLTQSEFDAIVSAIGKLSMEKGEYLVLALYLVGCTATRNCHIHIALIGCSLASCSSRVVRIGVLHFLTEC